MRQTLALFGFAFGLFAVLSQGIVTVNMRMESGQNLAQALLKYTSFLTILSNSTLVLIYLGAIVKGQRWLSPFRKPITRATAAAVITLVAVYYHWALNGLVEHTPFTNLLDILLHYVCPALYLAWYIRFNRSGTLKFVQAPFMLLAPLIYVTYVMFLGEITWEYPYPILDARENGYLAVAQGVGIIAVALLLLNLLYITIDRSVLVGKKTSS